MRTASFSRLYVAHTVRGIAILAISLGVASHALADPTYTFQSRTLQASGGNSPGATAPGYGPFNMSVMSTSGPFGQYGSASQVSSMNFAGILCTADGYGYGGNQMQSGGGTSQLHIHFTVNSLGPFHLTGGWDNTNYYSPSSSSMSFSDSTHTIATAGLFNILSLGQESMDTFDFSGILIPGTTYSLDIIADAGATGGSHTGHAQVYATMTVPEPGIAGAMGLLCVSALRRRRRPRW
jgi:hypothetical protein